MSEIKPYSWILTPRAEGLAPWEIVVVGRQIELRRAGRDPWRSGDQLLLRALRALPTAREARIDGADWVRLTTGDKHFRAAKQYDWTSGIRKKLLQIKDNEPVLVSDDGLWLDADWTEIGTPPETTLRGLAVHVRQRRIGAARGTVVVSATITASELAQILGERIQIQDLLPDLYAEVRVDILLWHQGRRLNGDEAISALDGETLETSHVIHATPTAARPRDPGALEQLLQDLDLLVQERLADPAWFEG